MLVKSIRKRLKLMSDLVNHLNNGLGVDSFVLRRSDNCLLQVKVQDILYFEIVHDQLCLFLQPLIVDRFMCYNLSDVVSGRLMRFLINSIR